MKISNFRLIRERSTLGGNLITSKFANIDVTRLFYGTEQKRIFNTGNYWYWADSGKRLNPLHDEMVDNLERAAIAEKEYRENT